MSSAHPLSSEQRRITRKIPATQLIALLLAFVLTAGAGGLIGAGMLIPLAAGTNTTVDAGVQLFDEVPDELELTPLSEQSRIFASDGKTLLASVYEQNRIVVPLKRISKEMQHAAIAIEDERFYEHNGVDPQGIARAAVSNASGAAQQGASTLTQQYVKNALIEEALKEDDPFGILDAREDSIQRKIREAKLSIAIEKKMSKDEILAGYLNVAQFGVSIYGVQVAAQRYFSKDAADLNVVEAATIAGITKEPSRFDPLDNPDINEERRNLVLNKMWGLGYITDKQYQRAKDTPIENTLKPRKLQLGCEEAPAGSAFFCDYVIKEFLLSKEFGETRDDRYNALYQGGLDIVTTLDMKKQRAAHQSIVEVVPTNDPSGLDAAITSVEPGTGKILSMAQNKPYDASDEPEPLHTAMNYSADFLHGGSNGFQPGSNFKPFVLTEWLRTGHRLNDVIPSSEVVLAKESFRASGCEGVSLGVGPWSVGNAEAGAGGPVTVALGTYQSLNTVYSRMTQKLDLCGIRQSAFDAGFQPTVHAKIDGGGPIEGRATARDIEVVPAMVLGTQPTTPLGMATAYATFASGGTYCKPIAISSVETRGGAEMNVPKAGCKQTLEPNVANTVAYAMTKVFEGKPWGTGYWVKDRFPATRPVAGKTGTTNNGYHSWFTGYTPNLSTSVWVGTARGDVAHFNIMVNGGKYNYEKPGQPYSVLYGSSLALPAWDLYSAEAMKGMPVMDFPSPDPNLVGRAPAQPTPQGGDDDDSGDSDDGGGNGGGAEGTD
ncbi:transglycosylase domain-containing protein [Myceligenerans xiligouense]|uniref:Membrane peptidoglycan carboxypeptidase n=1 Tax=Myceligenerans xiligouense TaxID=253184 RepID=A0A3N4ZIJ0_9MICO|nr:transglycosylase domain-containing protein [Myceligenerans xiligouense]RPF19731.1 membrane peptidoglycan carboxypeptidase [Myceligenerans xiligouense]